ncbi:ribose ABC transporter permease [Mesotoga sp. HF07.pep.5.2.highcov]|jgi:ribose transport system permease protein|uniref:Permease component of ribose/xylose/arabinose/galactoside ABC-type transporters n=1 Tax=Mesotoga prima MesG1.Ag.4.2 TaxID=660470 RepID=I2F719_9BACT|nr:MULTISPECIES: ABC transporter permease [Mesotoga]AFK07722.1 permease component of ribose/xylose/arabinose/galactoside ABC-type transporters [Mesotoga prima MesG1.Ag.4.2]MDK2943699.1 ribose transport system permease protein [Mesotoga sp.]PIJ63645.1 ribose ABC transporter permease [Mesotoga sp. H07.pep.5.3]RLL92452.1 ribose ABC transporter permease [Mesotoga sp. HF07.pep.5.2.highcov]
MAGENVKRRFEYERFGPLIALAILFVISAIASPYFLQTQNLLNILRQVSYTGIIALGMTFVIISGGIDLSVGSMVALVGGVVILALNWLLTVFGEGGEAWAILFALIIGLLFGAGLGALNGLMVTIGKIAPFIATLGTMAIFRSMALYIGSAGVFRSESNLFPDLGMGNVLGIPNPVVVFISLAVIFAIILNKTRYGRYLCAVGSNPKVAKYSAIKVNLTRFISYVAVGITVGFSAVFLSARLNSMSSTNGGLNYELDAIAAVIIGGTPMTGGAGSIFGTVIGAITLGIINNMLNMLGVSPYLQGTVKGVVIIGAVLIQRKRSQ